jgi:4'-phosphopantetheinyl transferase
MVCAETVWHRVCGNYELPADEVHVWRATLDQPQEVMARFLQVLSADENARAGKFHFEADRKRHIIGRGMSRLLLGHCLGTAAHQLKFTHNEFGKPSLSGGFVPRFNISHSGELVLVALARGRTIGVDVERMRKDMAQAEIAERFFSSRECDALAGLAPEMQCEAFFACWTRKEAYLKARGDGLSLPLDQFDVAFMPGEVPRLIETRHDPAEAQRWAIRALNPGYGCMAAVAGEGSDWTVRCWEWSRDAADALQG